MTTFLLSPFPDIELLVLDVLSTLDVENLEAATSVPGDDTASYSWLPFIRVTGMGGNDDLHTDSSKVVVDAFAATKEEASALAEQARQALISAPVSTDHGVMDRAVTNTKPNHVPYGDETRVVRYTAVYTVTARRSYS